MKIAIKINQSQLLAVIALEGPKRYSHFIKVAADQRKVWGLYKDGWALAATSDNDPVLPIWPKKEYAEFCATDTWIGYEAQSIDLDEVFTGLIPSLQNSGTQLCVFQTPTDRGVLPSFSQFEADIRNELSRIE